MDKRRRGQDVVGTQNAEVDSTRETLEQKRAILQSIKDFDFQIKKNQEDIGGMNKKMELLSKDLDDLVSLYEIVSEQMNPFVGLSKVTKKRLDALENLTKDVDIIKDKLGELESFAEQTGGKLQDYQGKIKEISNGKRQIKEEKIDKDVSKKQEVTPEEGSKTEIKPEQTPKPEIPSEDLNKTENVKKEIPTPNSEIQTPFETHNFEEKKIFTSSTEITNDISDDFIDMLLEQSLSTIAPEKELENIIEEFIENLKD